MVSGDVQLTVNDHSFAFEPATVECPSCGGTDGYNTSVAVTTAESRTEVAVTFLCDRCTTAVETVERTVSPAERDPADGVTDDTDELYDWIETYAEEEGRHPSKSKCIRECPFEVFEAQELLDELLEDDRIAEVEELRAGGKITVYEPR
ncbi:MAG: hypothetical protein ACOCY1_00550 [Halovenus sp.]